MHPNHIGGKETIAPSPIAISGYTHTAKGKEPNAVPREMNKEDIEQVIKEFRLAAENAKKAGFDGIELHMANGYIID